VPSKYVVAQGECVSSVGFKLGFFPRTLWDHPGNSELKALRGNANTLVPGDSVSIPDKRQKAVAAATGASHKFIRRGVPEKLHLQFLRNGNSRAGEPYTIVVDGVEQAGVTDGEGRIVQWLAPDAEACELWFAGEERYSIALRALQPIDQEAGQRGRLTNLGFLDSRPDSNPDDFTRALSAFQQANGLDPSGLADVTTLQALGAKHGS
jgi:hypothetical protein